MEIFTFSQTCNKTCVVIARYSASVQFAVDLDSLSAEILGKHFVDLFLWLERGLGNFNPWRF